MLIALLQFVLLVVSALDYPSPPHQMNSDLENQDTDYIFPSHHQIREHLTEDEEYFQRAPLVEHPFYNKQVYEPPEYSQRIPDEIFGEVPQAGLYCVVVVSMFIHLKPPTLTNSPLFRYSPMLFLHVQVLRRLLARHFTCIQKTLKLYRRLQR
jgi:hypothetical protein